MSDRRRPASHRGPNHPVTVHELITRCRTSAPPAQPPGPPVSVGALLRREGRARRAADRPLLPRGHSRPAPAPAHPALTGTRIRRATGAAGVLFTATAVLGPTVLSDPHHLRPETGAGDTAPAFRSDGTPGRPAPPDAVGGTAQPPVALAAVVVEPLVLPAQRSPGDLPVTGGRALSALAATPVPARSAPTGGLGTVARSTAEVPALAGIPVPRGAGVTDASTTGPDRPIGAVAADVLGPPAPSGPGADPDRAEQGPGSAPGPAPGPGADPGAGPGGPGPQPPPTPDPGTPSTPGAGEPGGSPSPPAGDGLGGIVATVAEPVGDLARPAGAVLDAGTGIATEALEDEALEDEVLEDEALVEPVTRTLRPVTGPVVEAVEAVAEPVAPLTAPLTSAAEPVTEPVTEPLDDVLGLG